MKAKCLTIPIDVIKRGVLVFIGSQQELLEAVRKKAPEDLVEVAKQLDDDNTTLARVISTATDAIIFAEEMPTIPVLIHEADHAVYALLNIIGADTSDEEVHAYFLEYICTKIFKWLNIPCDVPSQ